MLCYALTAILAVVATQGHPLLASTPVKVRDVDYRTRGDIQVPLHRVMRAAGASDTRSVLWEGGVVRYFVDTYADPDGTGSPLARSDPRIIAAIAEWERMTCIRFVPCDAVCQTPLVRFVKAAAGMCNSPVGVSPDGENQINIGVDCTEGTVMHEIGHTLGLHHEHTRSDRDEFVAMMWNRVIPSEADNFNASPEGMDIYEYDYDSVMHYGPYDFALNPSRPTIVSPRPIGQRHRVSETDAATIAFLYGNCTIPEGPRCASSRTEKETVLIPLRHTLRTTFQALHSAELTVSYFGTIQAVTSAGEGETASRVTIEVTPNHPGEGVVGVVFTDPKGLRCTTSLRVKVVDADGVCGGVLSTSPDVCSGHGECTGYTCHCQQGFAGPTCKGSEACPADYTFDFGKQIATGWSLLDAHQVQGALAVSNQAHFTPPVPTAPARLFATLLADERGPPGVYVMHGNEACFAFMATGGVWQADGVPVAPVRVKVPTFIDVRFDWEKAEVDILVDGVEAGWGIPLACPRMTRVVLFGEAQYKDLVLWCRGAEVPTVFYDPLRCVVAIEGNETIPDSLLHAAFPAPWVSSRPSLSRVELRNPRCDSLPPHPVRIDTPSGPLVVPLLPSCPGDVEYTFDTVGAVPLHLDHRVVKRGAGSLAPLYEGYQVLLPLAPGGLQLRSVHWWAHGPVSVGLLVAPNDPRGFSVGVSNGSYYASPGGWVGSSTAEWHKVSVDVRDSMVLVTTPNGTATVPSSIGRMRVRWVRITFPSLTGRVDDLVVQCGGGGEVGVTITKVPLPPDTRVRPSEGHSETTHIIIAGTAAGAVIAVGLAFLIRRGRKEGGEDGNNNIPPIEMQAAEVRQPA